MDPSAWGPHAWFLIESSVIHMPEDADISKFVDFLTNLQYVLPCKGCRDNYADHLKDKPPPKTTKKDLIDWVINLHNEVREYQGKSKLNKEDVIRYYTQKPGSPWILLIALVVLFVLIYVTRRVSLD